MSADLSQRVHDIVRQSKARDVFRANAQEYVAWRIKHRGRWKKDKRKGLVQTSTAPPLPFDRFSEYGAPPEEPIPSVTWAEKYAVLAAIHDNDYSHDGPIIAKSDCTEDEWTTWHIVRGHVRELFGSHVEIAEDWFKDVADSATPSEPPPGEAAPPPPPKTAITTGKTKRSTNKGDAEAVLVGALLEWHKYAAGGALNKEPINNNELANKAKVARSSASRFFSKYFGKDEETSGYGQYAAACRRDFNKHVLPVLKSLNGDYTSADTYGKTPPGEQERDSR